MKKYLGKIGTAFAVVTLVGGVTVSVPSLSKSRVTVGATETISSHNPHGDSISMGYGIWCQVYGCLGYFDFKSGSYKGMLAERWETDTKNPNIWTFYLRKGLKRHNDGKELTSADVVHAFGRMKTDPQSRQTQNVKHVAKTEAVDKYTVRVTTKKPTAPLLEFLFDRVMITSKDLFDK
ncbi:MAG: ABC transporter substrate-binding protein, partial [Betaproteobacteria bacterium]